MADQLTQKCILRMVDAAGKEGTVSINVTTDASSDPTAGLGTLVSALNGASNAQVVAIVGQTANNDGAGEVDTNVYDVRDKLAVEYVGSQNDHHTITIGDLDPAILSATNMETVDPTNDNWLALKSAIEANIVDRAGFTVTVIRGYRTRSKNLKTTLRFQ